MNFPFMFIILIIFITLTFPPNFVFGSSVEPILITVSSGMDNVIFDGKWTFPNEWKPTSLNEFSYDKMKIILRSAHHNDFIYFYIDALHDYTLNKGMDKATICFDGENDKNIISDDNDFCFSSTLGNKQGVVFQGGSINGVTGNFQKISNPKTFVGLSSMSDENNRYSKIPHVGYEFKIPIDLIKRSDNYGFYLIVYDAGSQSFYSWPKESLRENFFKIPSPASWGDLISPDKSLPELNFPLIIFMVSILVIIFLPFKTKNLIKNY